MTFRQRLQEATGGILDTVVLSNAVCRLANDLLPSTPLEPLSWCVSGRAVGDWGHYRLNCCRPVTRLTCAVSAEWPRLSRSLLTNAVITELDSKCVSGCSQQSFREVQIRTSWVHIHPHILIQDLHLQHCASRIHSPSTCALFTTL